jgi:hypothetical protein
VEYVDVHSQPNSGDNGGERFHQTQRDEHDKPDYYFTAKHHTNFYHPYIISIVSDSSAGVVVLSTDWIVECLDAEMLLPMRFYTVKGIDPPLFNWSASSHNVTDEGTVVKGASWLWGLLSTKTAGKREAEDDNLEGPSKKKFRSAGILENGTPSRVSDAVVYTSRSQSEEDDEVGPTMSVDSGTDNIQVTTVDTETDSDSGDPDISYSNNGNDDPDCTMNVDSDNDIQSSVAESKNDSETDNESGDFGVSCRSKDDPDSPKSVESERDAHSSAVETENDAKTDRDVGDTSDTGDGSETTDTNDTTNDPKIREESPTCEAPFNKVISPERGNAETAYEDSISPQPQIPEDTKVHTHNSDPSDSPSQKSISYNYRGTPEISTNISLGKVATPPSKDIGIHVPPTYLTTPVSLQATPRKYHSPIPETPPLSPKLVSTQNYFIPGSFETVESNDEDDVAVREGVRVWYVGFLGQVDGKYHFTRQPSL